MLQGAANALAAKGWPRVSLVGTANREEARRLPAKRARAFDGDLAHGVDKCAGERLCVMAYSATGCVGARDEAGCESFDTVNANGLSAAAWPRRALQVFRACRACPVRGAFSRRGPRRRPRRSGDAPVGHSPPARASTRQPPTALAIACRLRGSIIHDDRPKLMPYVIATNQRFNTKTLTSWKPYLVLRGPTGRHRRRAIHRPQTARAGP